MGEPTSISIEPKSDLEVERKNPLDCLKNNETFFSVDNTLLDAINLQVQVTSFKSGEIVGKLQSYGIALVLSGSVQIGFLAEGDVAKNASSWTPVWRALKTGCTGYSLVPELQTLDLLLSVIRNSQDQPYDTAARTMHAATHPLIDLGAGQLAIRGVLDGTLGILTDDSFCRLVEGWPSSTLTMVDNILRRLLFSTLPASQKCFGLDTDILQFEHRMTDVSGIGTLAGLPTLDPKSLSALQETVTHLKQATSFNENKGYIVQPRFASMEKPRPQTQLVRQIRAAKEARNIAGSWRGEADALLAMESRRSQLRVQVPGSPLDRRQGDDFYYRSPSALSRMERNPLTELPTSNQKSSPTKKFPDSTLWTSIKRRAARIILAAMGLNYDHHTHSLAGDTSNIRPLDLASTKHTPESEEAAIFDKLVEHHQDYVDITFFPRGSVICHARERYIGIGAVLQGSLRLQIPKRDAVFDESPEYFVCPGSNHMAT